MQYLIKFSLKGTRVWRLVALEGRADLAHTAKLICEAFPWQGLKCAFWADGKIFGAGRGGDFAQGEQLLALDDLLKNPPASLTLTCEDSLGGRAVLDAVLLRSEEKLSCLVPSCIVGAGTVPEDGMLDPERIAAWADDDAHLTLDLKGATKRMRAWGSVRADISKALIQSGADPLNFKQK